MPSTARNVIQSWIVQGKVQVNGKVVSKPGTPVSPQAKIDILAVVQQYVCRCVLQIDHKYYSILALLLGFTASLQAVLLHICLLTGGPDDKSSHDCRAGHKIEAALEHFNIDATGMTCLDAGLSTGGFTDCLLQKGAVKVYGIDVGFGQVSISAVVPTRICMRHNTTCKVDPMQYHSESLPVSA